MKPIPYGDSNFKKIITNNALYIDKTRFIEKLEISFTNYVIFLRPRRFGKTIFISILLYYYDEYYKKDWNKLFKNLYIGKNPTSKRSSYRILKFDFSGITTENIKTIERGFSDNIKVVLIKYLDKYNYNAKDIAYIQSFKYPDSMIKFFFQLTKNDKIYVLIDEYDHFANAILANNLEEFNRIITKGGFVRSFYEVLKTATTDGIVQKIFITGVTPITLDSMSSGFNITTNLSIDKAFNELAGFTLQETKQVLQNIYEVCDIDKQKLLQDLTLFYNGYKFNSKSKNNIYNSDMVLYFVKKFDLEECKYPERMLDDNIATDYGIVMKLFNVGNIKNNYKILQEIIHNGEVMATLKTRFELAKDFNKNDFITLLFYMGFVTIKTSFLNKTIFKIPNYVIKHLYYNYFQVEIERREQIKFNTENIENSIISLALQANIQPFLQELRYIWLEFSNRDMIKFEEKNLKAIVLTLLNLTDFYLIQSEPEKNKKYPDVMLLERSPFDVNYQFLFELKFSKKKLDNWEDKKIEGINQVDTYLKLPSIKNLSNLKSYVILANSEKLEIIEVR